jgi:hypothetical protein
MPARRGPFIFAARVQSRAKGSRSLSTATNLEGISSRPRNAILAQLPDEEYAALAKFLVPVELPLQKELSQPNAPIEFVYFLNSGLISTDAVTAKGEQVEVGVIWREGVGGLPRVL